MLDLQGELRSECTRRWVSDTHSDIHFSVQTLHPAQRALPGWLFGSMPCPRNQLPPHISGNSQARMSQPTTQDGFYQPTVGQASWLERHVLTVRFNVFATSVHNPRDLPGDGVEAQHLFLAQASPWIQLVGVRQLQCLQQLGSVVTQVSDGIHGHCPLRWSRGDSQGGRNYPTRSPYTIIAMTSEVCRKGRHHLQRNTEVYRAWLGLQENHRETFHLPCIRLCALLLVSGVSKYSLPTGADPTPHTDMGKEETSPNLSPFTAQYTGFSYLYWSRFTHVVTGT